MIHKIAQATWTFVTDQQYYTGARKKKNVIHALSFTASNIRSHSCGLCLVTLHSTVNEWVNKWKCTYGASKKIHTQIACSQRRQMYTVHIMLRLQKSIFTNAQLQLTGTYKKPFTMTSETAKRVTNLPASMHNKYCSWCCKISLTSCATVAIIIDGDRNPRR